MIYLASACIGYQITSISGLGNVGQIRGVLVDPQRFSVAGFWVEEYNRRRAYWPILLSQSLRQIHDKRVFINDLEDINDPTDLPRLKRVLKVDYQIPGTKVISTDDEYLGRAEDFSFSDEDFKIAHLIVKPPIHQRLRKTRLHFTRNQIEKVSRRRIEVKVGPQAQLHSLPETAP